MAVIYSRTFATGIGQYLSLNNNDYVRALSVGNNWNRLRIGILYSVGIALEGTSYPLHNVNFALGVCAGPAGSPSLYAPTHCIGFGNGWPGQNLDWTYNAGTAGNSYYACNSGWIFARVQNGTLATAASSSFTQNCVTNTTSGGALARRGLFMLDLTKSSLVTGNMTFQSLSGAVAHMSLDLTSSDLYYAMEVPNTTPMVQGTNLSVITYGNSISFDEATYGPFTHLFIYWNQYVVPLQLYEIAVSRIL